MIRGIEVKHTETEEKLIVVEYNDELRYINTHEVGDVSPQIIGKTDDFCEHYKGNLYWVIDTAKPFNEGEDTLVIYGDMKNNVWGRPHDMFYGMVEVDGERIQRFKKVMV